MSDNTLRLTTSDETHYRCGGVLRWEEQPQTLNIQTSHSPVRPAHLYWVDEPDWVTRCDRCGLVGIPVEPASA